MTDMLGVEHARAWLSSGAPSLDDSMFRSMARGSFESMYAGHMARDAWVSQVSYAIPCREAVEMLARRPLLEIGAGTGYWAALIRGAGGDVVATDVTACGRRNGYGHLVGDYHPTLRMTAARAVSAHPDRDVLCVWPSYQARWPAVAFARIAPGRTLHLVGEGAGGATGSDHMHDVLDRDFADPTYMPIPRWRGINDHLTSMRRRSEP